MNYFKLTPKQRVDMGYITWTDNFKINNSVGRLESCFYERFFISSVSFLRFLFVRPLKVENELQKLKNLKLNVTQMKDYENIRKHSLRTSNK